MIVLTNAHLLNIWGQMIKCKGRSLSRLRTSSITKTVAIKTMVLTSWHPSKISYLHTGSCIHYYLVNNWARLIICWKGYTNIQ